MHWAYEYAEKLKKRKEEDSNVKGDYEWHCCRS